MATGGGKKKDGSDGKASRVDGLGATLLFTGGALAGAALLFGAKKLYDYFSQQKAEVLKKNIDDEKEGIEYSPSRRADLSQSPFEDATADDEPSLLMMTSNNSMTTSNRASIPEMVISPMSDGGSSYASAVSLHDSLLDYYTSYVDIPQIEQALALSVVEEVGQSFQFVFDELLPGTPLTGLNCSGPGAEGLNVIRPDNFHITLQLQLDPKLWELIDAGQTLLGAHGYQLVKRRNLEFFSRGTTPYDKYLTGEYLSPQRLKAAFLDLTNRVNNWWCRHQIKSAVIGPSVKLHVAYDEGEEDAPRKNVTIELIPGVRIGGKQVLATTHAASVLEKPGYDNVWMQSFAEQEMAHLTSWRPTQAQIDINQDNRGEVTSSEDTEPKTVLPDAINNSNIDQEDGLVTSSTDQDSTNTALLSADTGCQLMCLKLLEAVRLNHPAQLGMLTPYSVRTILMHLMTFEDGWLQEELSERFLDTLKALEEYLRARNLPHFYCPKLNLFADIEPETLDMARDFIASIVGNNQFPNLLKTNY